MCGWGWGGNGWGWGGGVMTIVMALFLLAVIVVVAFAIGYLARRGGSQYNRVSSAATGPEDTLAHRFARGEIDDDEYRRRIALLREHREHV
jgi:putative membrane protein